MKAILQVADTGPLESLVLMLRTVGYDSYIPSEALKKELRHIGCDTVLDISGLVANWGYDPPFRLPEAGVADMARSDVVYVDIKAHRCCDKVVKRWPNLKNRVLWYRINGSMPEHVVNERGDHGDEVNPPCPVLTPNQWYGKCKHCKGTGSEPYKGKYGDNELCQNCDHCMGFDFSSESAYCMWPPFYRFDEYYDRHGRMPLTDGSQFEPPICLIHNLNGWGYRDLVANMRAMGVRCYGAGSPDGLVRHSEIPEMLSTAIAMVHLKSNDAPGYALYEAMAAGCPVICTRRLIWRCKMQDLLIPDETCLVFDRETHDGLTTDDVAKCTLEVTQHLDRLRLPDENERIGMAGRERLKKVMWSEGRNQDVASLGVFMQRHFGG